MRSVDEWVGKTDDSVIPLRVRVRVFLKYDGICQCGCSRRVGVGEIWQLDHRKSLSNGGEHRESNLQPLLISHHKAKTRRDVAEKSLIARKRAKHIGAKPKSRNPIPGSKGSGFRRKMDGTVVRDRR